MKGINPGSHTKGTSADVGESMGDAVAGGMQSVRAIHELFERQVERTPELIALEFGGQRLAYAELNRRADTLAHRLRTLDVKPDVLVALCVGRCVEMVVGILGILKAGGAYVPIDPVLPVDRRRFMLNDAEPKAVLTTTEWRSFVPETSAELIDIGWDQRQSDDDANRFPPVSRLGANADNLAYLMYTSGSTGRPKGAAMSHGSLVNLIEWHPAAFANTLGTRVLQYAALGFDVAFQEIFSTLSGGGTLVIIDEWSRKDPRALAEFLRRSAVERLFLPPMMLQAMTEYVADAEAWLTDLRDIITAGEQLRISPAIRSFFRRHGVCRLHNHYGPTETHVATALTLPAGPDAWPDLPSVGHPLPKVDIQILDDTQQPVPLGSVGEIYIGGVAVARGYSRRPQLTAERFLPDRLGPRAGGRLYRTGDLGRVRPDGGVEYHGRNDDQVKIRGFRIELGEIEGVMATYPGVRNAAVVAQNVPGGGKRLVGFFVGPSSRGMTDYDSTRSGVDDLVKEWRSAFDRNYRMHGAHKIEKLIGRTSSYTGLTISEEQLNAWVSGAAARVREIDPQRVLEIGSGTELMASMLAADCTSYHLSDFSGPAVEHLRRWSEGDSCSGKFVVSQHEASECGGVTPGSVDTIVINSVAQYFPDLGYLMQVIERAAAVVGPRGRIFIGDIRNFDLLELFYCSVQVFQSDDETTVEQLRARIRRMAEGERELAVAPRFFDLLPSVLPCITCADVQLKRGCFERERCAYRYDVVLYVGGETVRAHETVETEYRGSQRLDEVEAQLRDSRPRSLRLTKWKNSRVASDVDALRVVRSSGPSQRINSLRQAVDAPPRGTDPDAIWALAERCGYDAAVTWATESSEGEFDALFSVPSLNETAVRHLIALPPRNIIPTSALEALNQLRLANDPLAARQEVEMREGLREALKAKLPDYMLPAAIIMKHEFPISPNGKLDRRALEADLPSVRSSRPHEAPRGHLERCLAKIWQDVLGVESIGRDDNFFELGGHSLLIVQMLKELRRIGLTTQVRDAFESPTLARLAASLGPVSVNQTAVPPNLIPRAASHISPQMLPLVELGPEHIAEVTRQIHGGVENIQDIYPLAPLQEGLLFHHLLGEQGDDPYVLTTILRAESPETLDKLMAALQRVIDRHEVLRTAIIWDKMPRPIQVVTRRARLEIVQLALDQNGEGFLQLQRRFSGQRRLDLGRAPLLRVFITPEASDNSWLALLEIHHLICDNESLEAIFFEVKAIMEGRDGQLAEARQYRNFVAETAGTPLMRDGDKRFFRDRFGDVDTGTYPFGLTDVHSFGSGHEQAQRVLDPAVSKRLRAQAGAANCSAAALFHAACGLVVSRISGRKDVVFGSVLLGRLQMVEDRRNTIGMFINTLPIRMKLEGTSVIELLAETQRELVELLSRQNVSLADVQRCSGISPPAPLFSVLFNYSYIESNVRNPLGPGIQVLCSRESTNYPITIMVGDRGEDFLLVAQADQRETSEAVVDYMLSAVRSLAEILECAPDAGALSIDVLSPADYSKVISSFNSTRAAFPEVLIHELLEEQARITPDAVAMEWLGQTLTYAELNERTNKLARQLVNQGVRCGEFVPIVMPRCADSVMAQIAVLKSGGAYVPLEPNLPIERLLYLFADCGARRVISCEAEPSGLEQPNIRWHHFKELIENVATQTGEDLDLGLLTSSPAYAMYTSGSTGAPKGVVVPHRAVIRLVRNCEYARISASDCVAHCSNPAFDAATFEVFGALLNGARLIVLPQPMVMDADLFARALHDSRVSVLWITVGLLAQHLCALGEVLGQLGYLITGGDTLDPELVRRILRHRPPKNLLNAYGPTECTTFSTTYRIIDIDENARRIPIGKPIQNAQIYILDEELRPAPVGVLGEIYIGGAGVALGYLNRPGLTAERFIADPFSKEPGARIYHTGDLGRWRTDGNIEFDGRIDHQVKIRGFRIEPAEIEAQLLRHAAVAEAVVVVRETTGQKSLVAYVKLVASQTASVAQLRDHLGEFMPQYMIPAAMVIVDHIPINRNGKVDRRALPLPDDAAYVTNEYIEPEGEVEHLVADIWRDVLKVRRVGRNDDFFALGGHSLLAMQVLVRIRAILLSDFSVRLLFSFPTLAEFTRAIQDSIRPSTIDQIGNAEGGIDEILATVAAMSEAEVADVLTSLRKGAQS
jgi:amino acid adenylation domain-containing protein